MKDNLPFTGMFLSFGITSGIILARGLYLGWKVDDVRADISTMRSDISRMGDKLDKHVSVIMAFAALKNLPEDLSLVDKLKEDKTKKKKDEATSSCPKRK